MKAQKFIPGQIYSFIEPCIRAFLLGAMLAFVLSWLSGCEGVQITTDPEPAAVELPIYGPAIQPIEIPQAPCDSDRCRRELVAWITPYLDIPEPYRVRNYSGGSCVHASCETILHWQGQHEMAEWWRKTYHHGEYPDRMHSRLDAAGLKFAYVQSRGADGWEFLRKCVALRLGAAVNLPSGHMQTLVGMDDQYVYIIDNNGRGQIDKWPRQRFASSWTGWAFTVVGSPPPPQPYL